MAGGTGRNALWLAGRGLDVTLADVSDVALAAAAAADPRPGSLVVVARDLEVEPLPVGASDGWDVVLVSHYLQRSLFPSLGAALAPGGVLVYIQPTLRNLERHQKPGAPYLVAAGELRDAFAPALDILGYDEDWRADGRHQALLVARRR